MAELNINKILKFTFCLYGKKYKEKKTLSQVTENLVRTMSMDDVARLNQRAVKLIEKIYALVPLHGAPILEFVKINEFKEMLQTFEIDVQDIITLRPNLFGLAERAIQFQSEWNANINRIEGMFLMGYGPIHAYELSLTDLCLYFEKLKKASSVPPELSLLEDQIIQQDIVSNIKTYHEIALAHRG